MATIAENIELAAKKYALYRDDSPLLLMVSGGSDSTALTYAFNEMRGADKVSSMAAIHVNHKIRGDEADADQEFVEGLCDFLNIPLFIVEVDIPKIAAETGQNIEACARNERYASANEALASLCNHVKVPFEEGRIVTAHTLDDRVENFYMRSIVGTGPGGFRSMRFQSRNIIRPLLNLTRQDLRSYIEELKKEKLAYANLKGEVWREDTTNANIAGFRAFIRHELIPIVRSKNPNHAQTLATTMDLIADEDDMLDKMARELLAESVVLHTDAGMATIDASFANSWLPLMRRAAFILLNAMVPESERIENASVEAVLAPFANGKCENVPSKNIQCNMIVSSNKNGVTIESCESYRAKRKKM